MSRRKYGALKTLMYEREITQDDVAREIGMPASTLKRRFSGREPWDTDLMERVGEVLDIPIDQWLHYFYDGPAQPKRLMEIV